MDITTAAPRSAADRKRDRLDKNRVKSALKHDIPPVLSQHDVRAWDKAHAKRSDPRIRPEERLKAANACATIEGRLSARRDAHWLAKALNETITLETARGGKIIKRLDGGAIRDLGAGIAYLANRRGWELDQVRALRKYGDLYQAAQPSVKSILNDHQGDESNRGLPPASPPAAAKLASARNFLRGEPAMVRILDQVCGEERRISDLPEAKNDRGEYDDRKGPVLEERLRCAANLLSLFFATSN